MADMTRKLRSHPCYLPGEEVIEAIYGLGRGLLAKADQAAWGLGRDAGLFNPSAGYASAYDRAVEGKDGAGFAAGVEGNGVLALTDLRLLFFAKATVIGRPKNLTAEVSITDVTGAAFERPMVSVTFTDGSICGLHVPRNQRPASFVDALNHAVG